MDFLFGSPAESEQESSSSSYNQAYGQIAGAMAPTLGYTAQGGNAIASLLGLGGQPQPGPMPAPSTPQPGPGAGGSLPAPVRGAFQDKFERMGASPNAFQNSASASNPVISQGSTGSPIANAPNQASALEAFSNSTGMEFMRNQGIKALEGSQAGKGMLQSGATGTKLVDFGTKLGSTYLNQYIDKLFDYSKLGLGGANAMSAAGNVSNSSGTGNSTGAKDGFVQQAASIAANAAAMSDIRVKKNIVYVGKTDKNIPVYDYDFVEGMGLPKGRQRGPMAHEVRRIAPEAFVENFRDGYNGVRYDKIGVLHG